MSSTTRVPAAEISGIKGALMRRLATRMMGRVPTPMGVYWHNTKVLKASLAARKKVQKCDESLKSLAHMAVASLVGCTARTIERHYGDLIHAGQLVAIRDL